MMMGISVLTEDIFKYNILFSKNISFFPKLMYKNFFTMAQKNLFIDWLGALEG